LGQGEAKTTWGLLIFEKISGKKKTEPTEFPELLSKLREKKLPNGYLDSREKRRISWGFGSNSSFPNDYSNREGQAKWGELPRINRGIKNRNSCKVRATQFEKDPPRDFTVEYETGGTQNPWEKLQ